MSDFLSLDLLKMIQKSLPPFDFLITIVSSQYRLFKDYPETKAYFKNIPTEGNLQEDPLVRFHGRRVMVALNQVVENLDNWKQACRILDRLADKHKNVHQVPAVNFQVPMHADIKGTYPHPHHPSSHHKVFTKYLTSNEKIPEKCT
uniref:superoxide dismutase n=1 Tax=Terrapene triunguis TaxID=2587831 RepID=A0A674I6E0_9SAUR